MAVILPLACATCGRRVDLSSDQPFPRCPDCYGKMRPAGAIQNSLPAARDFYGEEIVKDNPPEPTGWFIVDTTSIK